MKNTFYAFISAIALSLASTFFSPATAQSAGSNVISVGWAHTTPFSSSELTRITAGQYSGVDLLNEQPMKINSANAVDFAITHFWSDHFATTLNAGIPPRFQLQGSGAGLIAQVPSYGSVGSVKIWNPSIVAKWFFGDAQDKFRPFIGAGVAYARFSSIQLTQSYQDAVSLATAGLGRATMKMSSSWAPVANIGANYNFDKNWSLALSVSYTSLGTNVDIAGTGSNLGPFNSRTTLAINPMVTVLALGYTF